MSTKTIAYSYLRISSDQQVKGDGVRRQLEASKNYADEHGYHLVEEIADIGISAFKGDNIRDGALGKFIAAIDAGAVQPGSILIVESLDRLSRDSVLKAFGQFTNILSKNITIVTLTDGQIYTEESVNANVGQLFTSIGIMLRSHEESATKSKRIRAAWKRKQESAATTKMTSMVPAWLFLSADREEILIDEQKANIVRVIFDLSIAGMGIYSITRHLNENTLKYPPITKALKWNSSFIAKILSTPATHGSFQPHSRSSGTRLPVGKPIENYYPAVITKGRFNLAQSRIKSRAVVGAGRKGKTLSNLFSGLISCGSCGIL